MKCLCNCISNRSLSHLMQRLSRAERLDLTEKKKYIYISLSSALYNSFWRLSKFPERYQMRGLYRMRWPWKGKYCKSPFKNVTCNTRLRSFISGFSCWLLSISNLKILVSDDQYLLQILKVKNNYSEGLSITDYLHRS